MRFSSSVPRVLFLLVSACVAACVAAGAWDRFTRTTPPPHGRVPMPVDHPVWRERHAEFVALSRQKWEVVCLGDSLTWGWDDHRDLWAERVTDRPTAFLAIGGDTTNNLLWRLENGELAGPPPKLAVVLIGTNNRWVKDDPADIAESIGAVVAKVRTNAAKVLVLGILPQGKSPAVSSRRVFAETNRLLMALHDGRTVFVRDVGGCLLETDGTLAADTSADGTHLTRAGYTRLADALRPLVRALIE